MSKIKVLHIVHSLCVGGIERMAVSVCNDLDKSIFNVTLLVLSNNNNTLKTHLNPGVNLVEMDSAVQMSGLKEMLRLFYIQRKVRKVIQALKPNIIHTHSFFYSVIPLFMVIRRFLDSTSHFHTIHTAGLHYALDKPNFKIRYEENWFKKNIVTVICVSKEVQRRVALLMPSIHTNFIPNYVSFKSVKQIVQRPIIDTFQVITIVYLARLTEGKNHRRLLESFSILIDTYPNAQLRLIGDGELRDELESLVAKLKIAQSVEFCGHSDQIQDLLQQCDIGVFPSQYEGFSVALIEMSSVGLPICCSDIDNFHDLSIKDGDMLYFDPFSIEDIATKLQLIVSDTNLRKHLSTSSIEISSNYTKEKVIPKYENLYGAIR